MRKISAFADEIGDDLDLQISTLKENDVGNIEFRGVWGKNVLDLTKNEIAAVKLAAADEGIGFSAVASPLGKFGLDRNFQCEIDSLNQALEFAEILEAPFVRLFSYYVPHGSTAADHRSQVIDRLSQLIQIAEKSSVMLAHENEAGIYGESVSCCLDLFESLVSPAFTGIFDFSNFVVAGEDAYKAWTTLRPHITYFHVKDNDGKGSVVPAGQGIGQIQRILAEAFADGFDNFISLEPHLSAAQTNYGRTSPSLFAAATSALTSILDAIE